MNDIAEDLAAAWYGSEEPAEETEQPTEKVVEDEVVEDVETPVEETGEQEEAGEETPEEKLEAPEHWAKEHRDLFNAQSKEVQEFMLERHKAMEGDYTRGKMEIADFKRTWEPVEQLFSQYPQLNPAETIQNWAGIAQALETNPQQTLQYLASQYRVDLSNTETGEQPEPNPEIDALRNELNGLKNDYTARFQEEQRVATEGKLTEIQQFSDEKDDQGNLLRPYIEEAMPLMIDFAKVATSKGEQPSLQSLYEQAVYANPELRAQLLQAEKAQEDAKRKTEAIAKAKKAKDQARSIESGAGESTSEGLSLREELERQFG